jgi:hypothetical protein
MLNMKEDMTSSILQLQAEGGYDPLSFPLPFFTGNQHLTDNQPIIDNQPITNNNFP